jgi:HEAT repeat protein
MGRWVSVKCAKESRTILYQSLLQLLNAQEDLVVRMTAVSDLGKVVDDFDFDITYFTPFLQQFVDLLMELLLKVDEFDSRLKIINSLIIIIERMDGQMLPSVVQLIQIIPDLWNRSADQHMFRNSIVTILTKLVQSLRQESHQLHPIVVPIIKESLNTSSVICN